MERPAIFFILFLTVLFVACEYPGVPSPHAKPHPTYILGGSKPNVSAAETKTPTITPPSQLGISEGPVEIALRDFRLDPENITVKAGKITFVLKNEGRYTHDFRVEGERIDEKAPKIGVGHSLKWEITLGRGEYQISCPISNHAERGMVGTLKVIATASP